jgi:hypothetical protein
MWRGLVFSAASTSTSESVHRNALNRVFHATMMFMQQTPLASLVKLFSLDQEVKPPLASHIIVIVNNYQHHID